MNQSLLDNGQRIALLLGRGLLGLYFIVPGISKITGWEGNVEYMAAHGVPLIPVALAITIVLQIGGGISLLAGYRTQLCGIVLAALTLLINIFMHDFWNVEDAVQQGHETQNFIKNLAIMAGLLYVAGARLAAKD
ncbi:MAG: DoxX family membrane protein [Pseudomonadales bacterium]|nr:DoxX family membrane protein [Pseudomonadales bacterium]